MTFRTIYRAAVIALALWLYFFVLGHVFDWLDAHVSLFRPLKPECQT